MSLNPDLDQAYMDLDLPPGAGLEQVKSAYRRLAKASHPDLNPCASGVMISRISRAYRVLQDHLGGGLSAGPDSPSSGPDQIHAANQKHPVRWRLLGVKRRACGLVYRVEISGRPRTISLPLRKDAACGHCGGKGERMILGGRVLCPACRGKGMITKSVRVELDMPPAWSHGSRFPCAELDHEGEKAWLELWQPADEGGRK